MPLDQYQMNQDLIDASRWLRSLCIDYEVRPLHWITGPDFYDGNDWCPDCAYYKCRNLRRHAERHKRDYFVDGGWRTGEEGSRYCCSCGVRLDHNLTDYGIENELGLFSDCGFSNNLGAIAYDLAELCDHLDWSRPGDERVSHLNAIITRFKTHYLATPKPTA